MHILDVSQNEEVLRFSLPLECEHCSTHTGGRKNHRVSLRSHLQLGNNHFGGRNARTALWPGLITVRTALWPGLITVRPALVPRRERGDPRPCLLSLTCFPEEQAFPPQRNACCTSSVSSPNRARGTALAGRAGAGSPLAQLHGRCVTLHSCR